jgi:xyloglucan-specific exo-beta-1,4-glucanase
MTRPTPMVSSDRGKSWAQVKGLPDNARPIADRTDPQKFYALDFNTGALLLSTDAGGSFAITQTSGLPPDVKSDEPTWHEAAWPLMATPTKTRDLWLVSKSGLFHSTDAGRSFAKVPSELRVEALGFGKAPLGQTDPALFAIGTMHELKAIWRSDDSGRSWVRVNDDQHQYGTRFRCISGDARIFGRVYVGTDGRGIVYGNPAR